MHPSSLPLVIAVIFDPEPSHLADHQSDPEPGHGGLPALLASEEAQQEDDP